MLISHRFDVTDLLRCEGENELAVRLDSAVLEGRADATGGHRGRHPDELGSLSRAQGAAHVRLGHHAARRSPPAFGATCALECLARHVPRVIVSGTPCGRSPRPPGRASW